jgi:radical SAM protein with 4Fe4S-binding SPASM domain
MRDDVTLHVRLTKACNADCSYCSSGGRSGQGAETGPMSVEDYSKALRFIASDVLPRMRALREPQAVGDRMGGVLTIQYVGGEVLTLPRGRLRACVLAARNAMSPFFDEVIDGVQSNLVGPEERILELQLLFGSRIGTSVSGGGKARTIAGDPALYDAMAAAGAALLVKRRAVRPGRILVADADAVSRGAIETAVADAISVGAAMTLRPAFEGARPVMEAETEALAKAFENAFDLWFMKGSAALSPHIQLLEARLRESEPNGTGKSLSGCPFQRDCASSSLDLEPDGTLQLCLDMADSGRRPLGNALLGTFDDEAFLRLAERRTGLDEKCLECRWLGSCHGGCMNEGIAAMDPERRGEPPARARTKLCDVWKTLFARIDAEIETRGVEAVKAWTERLA